MSELLLDPAERQRSLATVSGPRQSPVAQQGPVPSGGSPNARVWPRATPRRATRSCQDPRRRSPPPSKRGERPRSTHCSSSRAKRSRVGLGRWHVAPLVCRLVQGECHAWHTDLSDREGVLQSGRHGLARERPHIGRCERADRPRPLHATPRSSTSFSGGSGEPDSSATK